MKDEQALPEGLYEALVTPPLEARLGGLDDRLVVERDDLVPAEAARRIALHLERIVARALDSLPESQRAARGLHVARALVAELGRRLEIEDAALDAPVEDAPVLRAILGRRPDGTPDRREAPLTPLLDTTLLTNSPGEPRVGRQLVTEIDSADRVDLLMAFVRRSGLVPFRDALSRHRDRGRSLRVLTTTYTGSTEGRALDLLREWGAEVRVSYDTSASRLHAKAWLFHRRSTFSTAFVGSSNLTRSAQVEGLEWNVRVSAARNPDVVEKIRAVFEAYWEGGDFVPYDREEFERRTPASGKGPAAVLVSPVELRAEPFQARMLEQLAAARRRGRHRNLLVAATGTGKTVMAALDYVALRRTLPRARLLFVAHRRELLDQARATFAHAVRDAAFGEHWVAGERPRRFEHVFASIQSLSRAPLDDLAPDHFDVVVVDEFHHAAAASYERLLQHLQPRELLGMTATPERSDGLPLLHWFEGRIAAELRLWDAIDQHRLTPFCYYGIHDGVDLRDVPWRRGRGYDVEGLSRIYSGDDLRARLVVRELDRRADDVQRIRALGFCVSVDHARFMARHFCEAGLPAAAVWGDGPPEERARALRRLEAGELRAVFSVDLLNEGVDLPDVDVLLLLRPTDSPTLFLQQLGRGLRRAPGKSSCLVLDFVGRHRSEFRFDRRLRALLGGTRREVEEQVRQGFPYLPAGCHFELDRIAETIVLDGLRAAVPAHWTRRVEELQSLVAGEGELTLQRFLAETGLELADLYAGGRGWSDLLEAAGAKVLQAGPHEKELRRAIDRLRHTDDDVRVEAWMQLLARERPPRVSDLPERDRRLLRMLVAQLQRSVLTKETSLQEAVDSLFEHPQVRAELRELLPLLADAADHVPLALDARPEVPLLVHARYTRDEILAAFGVDDHARVAPWQTGVRHVQEARADLLAFTLDKTDGRFSPTTRYRDHAISRELIHWESQSTTREESEVGRRYRQHVERGSEIMLFARLRTSDRAFWFLGPATYVRHEGERPMAITWRLAHPLPGDLFQSFAAAVA